MREGFRDSHRKSLSDLLTGKIELIKKPWKPVNGEIYYCVSEFGEIEEIEFDGQMFDLMCVCIGNAFRKETEAAAHRDEIMAKFKAVME